MPDQSMLTPETIVRIFEEILGTPLPEADSQPVAELIRGLQTEMSAMSSTGRTWGASTSGHSRVAAPHQQISMRLTRARCSHSLSAPAFCSVRPLRTGYSALSHLAVC